MTEKTVPMKYRRMEFNAQLQTENDRLRAQRDALLEALQSIADCCDEEHAARDYASRQTEIRGIARAAIKAVVAPGLTVVAIQQIKSGTEISGYD